MATAHETKNRNAWVAAIGQLFTGTTPQSRQWINHLEIRDTLQPFLIDNMSHVLLPTTGGIDVNTIHRTPETGCLEFRTGPNNSLRHLFHPSGLFFEYVASSPWDSFFLLETDRLSPQPANWDTTLDYENVTRLPPGGYIDDFHFTDGTSGTTDEVGRPIPLPRGSVLVTRHLRGGKFLIVAKTSFLNYRTNAYDGRHNTMTAQEIRGLIETAIAP